MFTEILKVKPVLDQAAAKQMESSLSKRLANVAKKFGKGLMGAGKMFENFTKGTIIFALLGAFTKLMNPLNEMEERIKTLLGAGTDLKETADQFGTTAGKMIRLQDVAKNIGVMPDKLNSMMMSFTKAVEDAEFAKMQGKELTDDQKRVEAWMGQSDRAEAFLNYLQSLSKTTGLTRAENERAIFGEQQKGSAQRLIDANFAKEFAKLGTPGIGRTDKAIDKNVKLAEQERRATTARESRGLVEGSEGMNSKMIKNMGESADRAQERQMEQMKAYDDLARAKEGIDTMVKGLDVVTRELTKTVGYMGRLINWIDEGGLTKELNKFWEKMKNWRPWK